MTPWDRFLAGDQHARTAAQRRGAKLFFTKAENRSAGCFTDHGGPMLNKQANDPDVPGVGQFVEENFFNLGLADHPVQALNREIRNDSTFRDDDVFIFRALTLRQLKDGRFFFHNGSFTNVQEVVSCFNAGVSQDAQVAVTGTLTARFRPPTRRGIGPRLGSERAAGKRSRRCPQERPL